MNSKSLKIFAVSFILVFLMASLPRLGVRANFISPIPSKQDIFDKVSPKLKEQKNDYQLKKNTNFVAGAFAAGDFDSATSYIVVDYDSGEILAEKKSSDKLPVASLTKLMSAVVALDLADKDENFSVSEKAATQIPTRLALSVGDKLSLEELLNAALLVSANDCAQVISEGIDQKYGGEIFVKVMNEKAKFLGLRESFFTNPQGFDDGGPYSSAEDLATLTHYALANYPLISSIVGKDHAELIPTPTHQKYEYLNNWNGLLGVYPGVSGVKIGNTDEAGYTTIVLSERNDKKILVVLLGAPGVIERDLWASELLNIGFSKFGLPSIKVTEAQLKEKYSTWKYFN